MPEVGLAAMAALWAWGWLLLTVGDLPYGPCQPGHDRVRDLEVTDEVS